MLFDDEYYADWPADDYLDLDSLDSCHETVVKVCQGSHWLREVNQLIDKAVDYDREMSYIDDVFDDADDRRR